MEVDKRNSRILTFNFYLFISIFSINVQIEAFDYKDALQKSLLYFEAQRSGHLPHNQRVTWRGHSGLIDGFEQGVDLVGGYYDAGDHVKFGLPMAFTITMLSWTVIEYGPHIEDVGEYYHALEAIKWGTDYFIKAHTKPNVLWAEVGDGATDHYCWQRPEDMTTSRRAYKIDQDHPGSDLAGETSAAMAAASIVFRKSNSQYSNLLLHHARQLFDFADRYRGKYDESVRVVKNYYGSLSSYKDELLWAALWLYRATSSKKYKRYAVQPADEFGGTGWGVAEFSWDMKYAGVQILATKLLGNNKNGDEEGIRSRYQSKAEHYICACLNMNNNDTISANVHRTPGGLLFIRQWSNMQYVTNAVFLLTIYADYLQSLSPKRSVHCPSGAVTINQIWSLAKSQVDYILGNNPINMSYLVGFGRRYPTEVHHRGASIISYKMNHDFIGCSQGYDHWYSRKGPNPNVLFGAIVGGPNHMDEFRDERGNFMQMEACTYNTAPLVGIFAKLHRLENQHFIRCKPPHSSPSFY